MPPSKARGSGAGSAGDEAAGPDAAGPRSTATLDAAPSAPSRASLPRTIGRYQVIGLVGQGGMGAVYRVRDPELDRDLAVKIVLPRRMSIAAQARLLNEARALAKLRHPNVLPLYDVLDLEHQLALVMPFLPGGTLRDWLAARRRTPAAIVQMLCAAGRGLAAAHDAGVVHCDFKPSNVLLGEHGEALVADFGLSIANDDPSAAAPAETQPSAVHGTPGYMAPEQIRGQPLDARSDQFAFALTAWEALTGALPFAPDEDPATVLAQIERGPPRTAGRAPRRLLAPLRRALAADPDDRWLSMAALLTELARYGSRRRSAWWAAGAAAGIGLVALGIWATSGAPAPDPSPAPTRTAVARVSTRGTILSAAVSRDGRRLVAVEPDGVLVWDLERDVAGRYIAIGPTQAGPGFLAPAISPDGRHAIVLTKIADDDVPVRVELDTGAHARLPQVGLRFAYLDDERVAAFRGGGGAAAPVIEIYDARTLSVVLGRCTLPAEAGRLLDVVASGPYLYALARGRVRSIVQMSLDCASPRVHLLPELAPGVGMRAPHPAGGIVILTARAGAHALHRLRPDGALEHLADVAPPEPIQHVVGRDARGRILLIGGAHRWRLVELDAAGGLEVKASGQSEVAFSYDRAGARIARVDQSAQGKTVRVLPYAGLRTEPPPLAGLPTEPSWALRWSPDGAWLAWAQPDGVTLVHVATGERRHVPTSRASELAFLSADRVVTMTSLGAIEVIGLADRAVAPLVAEGTARTLWLQACPAEGRIAYYVQGAGVTADLMLLDARAGAPTRVRAHAQYGLPFSWSADCKLHYPGPGGEIEIYDPARDRWTAWGRYRLETGEHVGDLWVVDARRLLMHVERAVRDVYAVEVEPPGS